MPSGVHEHSAVIFGDTCFVAVILTGDGDPIVAVMENDPEREE
jgi:hypothetical protein